VIRTTVIHSTNSKCLLFSPIAFGGASSHNREDWSNLCGVAAVDAAFGVDAANNTAGIHMPLDNLAGAAEVLPCALTVQVMNPAALMSASGLFAMGRVNQQLKIGGDSRTWAQLKDQFISYFSPRMLTGGKLALQGVTCNSYPLDMTDFSDFRALAKQDGSHFTMSYAYQPAAMAPIVFVNQSDTAVELQFLVTMEWRVRFDPGNPAAASHQFQGVTSDKTMDKHLRNMASKGHGVTETQDVNKASTSRGGA
jgi:hypothetical protein